jgi:hypothetical protein
MALALVMIRTDNLLRNAHDYWMVGVAAIVLLAWQLEQEMLVAREFDGVEVLCRVVAVGKRSIKVALLFPPSSCVK